jgi:hypothetical protein
MSGESPEVIVHRLFEARRALDRHDQVIPIEAAVFVRGRCGPGSYEKAVEKQQADRQMAAIWQAARGPAVEGENPAIAAIRKLLAQATPVKPGGTP